MLKNDFFLSKLSHAFYMDGLKSLTASRRRAAQITKLRIEYCEDKTKDLLQRRPYNYLEQLKVLNERIAMFNEIYETQRVTQM